MAITKSGREVLDRMVQTDLFERLKVADPSAARGLVPWDGRSPRDLTAARKGVSLGHEGASLNEVDAAIDEMCRRHFHGFD